MGHVTQIPKNIAVRDLEVLNHLNALGLAVVEIRISEVSPVKNKWAFEITLPGGTRLICLATHDGRIVMDPRFMRFGVGDAVYLVTDDEAALRPIFTGLEFESPN